MYSRVTCAIIVLVGLACVVPTAFASAANGARTILPWLCLERCDADITPELSQMKNLSSWLIHTVSYEHFDLRAAASLVPIAHMTDAAVQLRANNQQLVPMITSANITNMRELFANPQGFIGAVVAAGKTIGVNGFNVDFEPESGVVATDGEPYAQFLQKFGDALHAAGMQLSVDIASWDSSLWNFTRLNEVTSVDVFMTMDTYAGGNDAFAKYFDRAVSAFGPRAGIGLMTVNPTTNQPFSLADMQFRFDYLTKAAATVRNIGIWDAPIPVNWLDLLTKWQQMP